MGVELVALALCQWQAGEKIELAGVELGSRPIDHIACFRPHLRPRTAHHGLVMVAEHGDRALADHVAHLVHHPGRIRAIADEVAQQHPALHALVSGMVEHGFDRFAVGMQVGDEGAFHGRQGQVSPVAWRRLCRSRLTGLNCAPALPSAARAEATELSSKCGFAA